MPRFWRNVVAGCILVLFACQGYLIQTHIHGLPVAAPHVAGWYTAAPAGDQLPLDQDHCPICQAAFHAGAFLTPAAFAAAPAVMAVMQTPLAFALLVRTPPVSHIWCGRAPPTHL